MLTLCLGPASFCYLPPSFLFLEREFWDFIIASRQTAIWGTTFWQGCSGGKQYLWMLIIAQRHNLGGGNKTSTLEAAVRERSGIHNTHTHTLFWATQPTPCKCQYYGQFPFCSCECLDLCLFSDMGGSAQEKGGSVSLERGAWLKTTQKRLVGLVCSIFS